MTTSIILRIKFKRFDIFIRKSMDPYQELHKKLHTIHDELQHQETKLTSLYKQLSENPKVSAWEQTELRNEYHTHLQDYEVAYDNANRDYQQSIEGLSEAYLSMCPFYKGPSLPKATFLDSPNDIRDLYALFLLMGVAHMYGIS